MAHVEEDIALHLVEISVTGNSHMILLIKTLFILIALSAILIFVKGHSDQVVFDLVYVIYTALFVSLIVTKQSGYDQERRSFVKDARNLIDLDRMEEFQTCLNNYLFFLEDTGLTKTKEKILRVSKYINQSNACEVKILVDYIAKTKPGFLEQVPSLLKL